MPKETIVNWPESNLGVEVCWGRDRQCQVAAVNYDKPDFSVGRGWYVELDRDALNRLIRVLRRARDQAYGEDA